MKFIKSETIKAEVKEKLHIFFESNKVSDSLFYPVFVNCMSKFTFKVFPQKTDLIQIKNKEGILPNDFKKLNVALVCDSYTEVSEKVKTMDTWDVSLVDSNCCINKDDNDNMFSIVQTYPGYALQWYKFDLLKPSKDTRSSCSDGCLNLKSTSLNEIDIRNGKIHTSFDEGLIYIEYLGDLESNYEFDFPDNPTVIEWIKAELIHEIFQTLYYNGESDIERRYRDAKQDVAIKYNNAYSIIKRSEVKEFYNLANKLILRYKKVANLSNPIKW